MTVPVAARTEDAVASAHGRPSGRRWWVLGAVAVLLAVTAVLGLARWTGEAPVGSDNDEYRLVARQLLGFDAPVVAGVEGTKYPLGYPAALAAVDAVGLPLVGTALLANVVLVGAAAGLTALAARHRGPVAAVVAAGVVVLSRPLWAATQSTMPDVALTAVVAGTLALAAAPRRLAERTVAVGLTGLVVVATALKSVGVLVGLAATATLLAARRVPRWLALAPAGAAIALSAVTAAVVGRYPEHTTGYARTFFLADPYDAAGGDASLPSIAGRLLTRADVVATDASRAVWGELVHGWPAWVLTAVLLVAGVVGARRPTFVGAFVAFDLAFLALWPYASVRFGLPLVPVAALGAGTLAAAAVERLRPPQRAATAVAVAAVVALAVAAVPTLDREADREAAFHSQLDDARRDAAAWLDANAPDAVVVSPDYRELATVLDEPVLALSYTSDADDLLAEATRGTHLVRVRGLYGSRDQVVATLLGAHGSRFEQVHADERVEILRLVPEA